MYFPLVNDAFADDDLKAILAQICRSLVQLRLRVGAIIEIPPFWNEGRDGRKEKTVNLTGAGNAIMGSVGVSFIIEQKGLFVITKTENERELWNEESPWERLKAMFV
ncbi:uncharacterized protein L203_100161 [Cryptococcus depauperatus CBS 7841]|uniref:Uncharacterized protein n=1 Tax=Cryptococcus depauperatus CBS 7841 TaxID=1295531 RepID=A0AAJ8LWJ6_9TREE